MHEFLHIFYELFFEMAFYLMLGLFFVGFLFIFVSKEKIVKYLGGDSKLAVVRASIFGVPLPLCSCGVIPTAAYLSKSGASRGSVVSFLTSTPQTGVDSIIATYGLMGPVYAIYRPITSLAMGIISGLLIRKAKITSMEDFADILPSKDLHEDSRNASVATKIKSAARYSFVEFLDDISVRFIIGLVIASMITYFVPDSFFADSRFSSGILGMLVVILLAAPMYVCATASIPIAVSLLLKGFSPGVAFIFLAVGPAVNAASFTIIMKVLGKKISFIYITILIALSIVFAYFLDFIFAYFELDPLAHISLSFHNSHNEHTSIMNIIFGSIFAILLLMSIYRLYFRKYFVAEQIAENDEMLLQIKGMNCNHCVASVSSVLNNIDGIECFSVNLQAETALIKGNAPFEVIKQKIEEVGYSVKQM